MIVSFKHKGLRLFYEKGDSSRLPKPYVLKIRLILTALDAVSSEIDIKALGKNVHLLKGEYEGYWAISITPNYRIIFKFVYPDIIDVDWIDYH